jgi:predicted nucleotidyltransferase
MKANDFGLTAQTVENISGVLARHAQVQKAVLYGSRAKGNYKNGSDIDLTLFGDGLTRDELFAMVEELDDLLLPYMIDLSIFHQLNHEGLKEHIKRVGKIFYERTPVEAKH